MLMRVLSFLGVFLFLGIGFGFAQNPQDSVTSDLKRFLHHFSVLE